MKGKAWSIGHRVKRQRSEVRDQRSEVRGQKEIRSQKTEVRRQREVVGGWRLEVRRQKKEGRG
jgi:hypothetical protein